ncbi:MAG: OsmC family protein [Bacteroidia bacterium]
MHTEHHYKLATKWHGNRGTGTSHVSDYDRSHTITVGNKPELNLTTDDATHGDKSKLNPEDLLVSAISSCHMLSYLYLCAKSRVVIIEYTDNATGTMIENSKGGGQFKEVTLNPVFTVTESSMIKKAIALHHKAHEICFIANSVNFKVIVNPICKAVNE